MTLTFPQFEHYGLLQANYILPMNQKIYEAIYIFHHADANPLGIDEDYLVYNKINCKNNFIIIC